MPPFLGQGMCSGIRDAATLAWQLDLVLRGEADESLLDGYTRTRRPHVERYVRESMRVGAIVCETDPHLARRNIDAMTAAPALPAPFQPAIGDDTRPGDGLAGRLSVQPFVSRDGHPPVRLDDVVGPGFQLLTTRPLQPAARSIAAELGRRIGLRCAVIGTDVASGLVEDGDAFTGWLADAGAAAVVVRPDHYVYGSCPTDAGIAELLTSLGWDLQLR